jgi:hypothetical protein
LGARTSGGRQAATKCSLSPTALEDRLICGPEQQFLHERAAEALDDFRIIGREVQLEGGVAPCTETVPATPPTAADATDASTASTATSGLSGTKITTAMHTIAVGPRHGQRQHGRSDGSVVREKPPFDPAQGSGVIGSGDNESTMNRREKLGHQPLVEAGEVRVYRL